jgi:hypothetical protein
MTTILILYLTFAWPASSTQSNYALKFSPPEVKVFTDANEACRSKPLFIRRLTISRFCGPDKHESDCRHYDFWDYTTKVERGACEATQAFAFEESK